MTASVNSPKPDQGVKKTRKRTTHGKGVLLLVTVLLTSSGILRFAGETNHVIAQGLKDLIHEESPTSVDCATSCPAAPDVSSIIAALDLREARIKEREGAVADRLAALNLAETEIRKNLAKLKAAEERLTKLMALSDEASEGDLTRLTTVYEAMKPKDAAILFEEMAPEFAAGFLGRMRPDLAAAIMSGLAPETAYTISVILAGRNANAPTE